MGFLLVIAAVCQRSGTSNWSLSSGWACARLSAEGRHSPAALRAGGGPLIGRLGRNSRTFCIAIGSGAAEGRASLPAAAAGGTRAAIEAGDGVKRPSCVSPPPPRRPESAGRAAAAAVRSPKRLPVGRRSWGERGKRRPRKEEGGGGGRPRPQCGEQGAAAEGGRPLEGGGARGAAVEAVGGTCTARPGARGAARAGGQRPAPLPFPNIGRAGTERGTAAPGLSDSRGRWAGGSGRPPLPAGGLRWESRPRPFGGLRVPGCCGPAEPRGERRSVSGVCAYRLRYSAGWGCARAVVLAEGRPVVVLLQDG